MQTIDQPFVKIVIPAVAGVVAARLFEVPTAVAAICFAAIFACTVVLRRRKIGHIYLWFTISLFFFAVATFARPRAAIPQGVRIEAVAQIADDDEVVDIVVPKAEERFLKQFDHLVSRLVEEYG